jgi:diacylglycerol kinase (ATP)
MKVAKLVHNPTAGDEDFNKKEIVSLLENEDYECRYSSTKKDGWEEVGDDVDFIVVAGGDGTMKKMIEVVLNLKVKEHKWPIALLPMGTANNIAKTLGVPPDPADAVRSWQAENLMHFDIGVVETKKDTYHFLEAIGYGSFPRLIKAMKNLEKEPDTPEEELLIAQETFYDVLQNEKATKYNIEIDDQDYSGEYIMVEIMNIRSVGPNVLLAPEADPSDGKLDVVLIDENHRQGLLDYLRNKINGVEVAEYFHSVQAKKIKIETEEEAIHIDDKLIDKKMKEIEVSVLERAIDFLMTKKS